MPAYLDGNDPVSGKPLMKEVVDSSSRGRLPRKSPRLELSLLPVGAPTFIDTSDNLQQYSPRQWHDGFHARWILPTQEKVDAMLKGTSHMPDEVVGKMTPARGAFPEWRLHRQAGGRKRGDGGATPDYFPTLLAIASRESQRSSVPPTRWLPRQ